MGGQPGHMTDVSDASLHHLSLPCRERFRAHAGAVVLRTTQLVLSADPDAHAWADLERTVDGLIAAARGVCSDAEIDRFRRLWWAMRRSPENAPQHRKRPAAEDDGAAARGAPRRRHGPGDAVADAAHRSAYAYAPRRCARPG
jgi:hypothetical protein